jgi:putative colanic acid biosynthesis acetyltransferase WcaF
MTLIGAPIIVEADVWVAADVFIGPGVTVGAGAVVGARSSVFRDVEPWTVVAGLPARKIADRPPFRRPGASGTGQSANAASK